MQSVTSVQWALTSQAPKGSPLGKGAWKTRSVFQNAGTQCLRYKLLGRRSLSITQGAKLSVTLTVFYRFFGVWEFDVITWHSQTPTHSQFKRNWRMSGQANHWCLTWHAPLTQQNSREEWREECYEKINAVASTKYCILGLERCPTTLRVHLQGFVAFEAKQRLSKIKKIDPTIHWERRMGSVEQAIEYCKKEEEWKEWGTPPLSQAGNRERDRHSHIRDLAVSGDLNAIAEEYPADWLRSYSTLKRIKKDHMALADELPDVCGVWIQGPSGCGKSRKARADYGQDGFYYKLPNKWWDGYQQQNTVIIEDFGKEHHVLGYHLKIWADRYAFLAEEKGGATSVRPARIVVTSQYRIADIWMDDETVAALERRFTVVDMF